MLESCKIMLFKSDKIIPCKIIPQSNMFPNINALTHFERNQAWSWLRVIHWPLVICLKLKKKFTFRLAGGRICSLIIQSHKAPFKDLSFCFCFPKGKHYILFTNLLTTQSWSLPSSVKFSIKSKTSNFSYSKKHPSLNCFHYCSLLVSYQPCTKVTPCWSFYSISSGLIFNVFTVHFSSQKSVTNCSITK